MGSWRPSWVEPIQRDVLTRSDTLTASNCAMSRAHLLHEEETFPSAFELLVPEMAGNDWPGPCWGQIWCERAGDGSWSIWYMSIELDKEPEELERVTGLRTPEAFNHAYHDCGVDFGCHPDGTDLSDHLDVFEKEDPDFARAWREWDRSA